MEFGLLGPLRVRVHDQTVPIRSGKHRSLLAALLLHPNQPVSVADLVDVVWGDRPPAHPRNAVQISITRLRTVLGPAIRTTSGGYAIAATEAQVDLGRFQADVRRAGVHAGQDDLIGEAEALHAALTRWRGSPLDDVPSEALHRDVVPALVEQRLHALERRIDIDLRLGRHADVVGELVELTARYPLRERLWAQLITALDGNGRRADALAAYQTLRRHLADELAIEPGDEVRELYATVLAGRPDDDTEAQVTRLPVPRFLPPGVRGFTGRTAELGWLDALLDPPDGDAGAGSVLITTITGTPGVGKTALAAHWSRRVADRFPDGQLWANLRGYDAGQATPPEQALITFLRALGVPDTTIPPDLDDRTNLYRSMVDGRRILVVLDNAGSPEQVRPLLPGTPGCLVVVTSRDELAGLAARDGAVPLRLDLLDDAEAKQLLAGRLGAGRVRAEPAAVAELVEFCARLPLALAIVAARAAGRPDLPLAALVAELRDDPVGLNAFADTDAATDVRAVFSWSYRSLKPDSAALFRLLGLHPGQDIGVAAAASLIGLDRAAVRPLLTELGRAHLIIEDVPGRYTCHDLLRAYAAELGLSQDSPTERDAATHRMLDHYLHTGYAAALLLHPHRGRRFTLTEPLPGVTVHDLDDLQQAMDWFDAERPTLLAAVDHAAATGHDSHAWQSAWTLSTYLQRQGHWHDSVAVMTTAVAAAQRHGDPVDQATAHSLLGLAHSELGQAEDARPHLDLALELYERLDDPSGLASTHYIFSGVAELQGKLDEALWHAERAYDRYGAADRPAGQASALGDIGWFNLLLGNHDAALDHSRRALASHQRLGNRPGQAAAWHSLGYCQHQMGRYPDAIASYRQAIDVLREIGDRFHTGQTLHHLGDSQRAAGDPDAARESWREALTVLDELGHSEADEVRAKLDQ